MYLLFTQLGSWRKCTNTQATIATRCSSRRNCSRLQFTDTQPEGPLEKHPFSFHFMRAFTSSGLQTSTDKLKSLSVPGTSLLHQCWPQPAVSGSRAKHGCLTTGFALSAEWETHIIGMSTPRAVWKSVSPLAMSVTRAVNQSTVQGTGRNARDFKKGRRHIRVTAARWILGQK